jgi:hypothetical protein
MKLGGVENKEERLFAPSEIVGIPVFPLFIFHTELTCGTARNSC